MSPPAVERILKLPPGFEAYQNPSHRPLTVSSAHVKEWLRFWWGGVNADTYLEALIKSAQLMPVDSPFKRKRFFGTEAVLSWALANGAGSAKS